MGKSTRGPEGPETALKCGGLTWAALLMAVNLRLWLFMWEPGTIGNINLIIRPGFTASHIPGT